MSISTIQVKVKIRTHRDRIGVLSLVDGTVTKVLLLKVILTKSAKDEGVGVFILLKHDAYLKQSENESLARVKPIDQA